MDLGAGDFRVHWHLRTSEDFKREIASNLPLTIITIIQVLVPMPVCSHPSAGAAKQSSQCQRSLNWKK